MKLKKIKNKEQGFSLPELIVIIALFALMSGVTAFNHTDFQRTLKTSAVAHDIGVSIRQAQVYGISASERNIGGEGFDSDDDSIDDILEGDIINDRSIRGVSIDIDSETLHLFQDLNQNNEFDGGQTDQILDRREIIDQLVGIERVCFGTTDLEDCGVNGGVLDITFQRPFPDATIYWDGDEVTESVIGLVVGTDDQEDQDRYIEIWSSGNIIVR